MKHYPPSFVASLLTLYLVLIRLVKDSTTWQNKAGIDFSKESITRITVAFVTCERYYGKREQKRLMRFRACVTKSQLRNNQFDSWRRPQHETDLFSQSKRHYQEGPL